MRLTFLQAMFDSIGALLLLNALVCLTGIGLCIVAMRRQRRLLLLPCAVLVFLLTNGLLQGAQVQFNLGVLFPTSLEMFQHVLIADAIVVLCAAPLVLVLAQLKSAPRDAEVGVPFVAVKLLTLIAGMSIGYFVLRNYEIIPVSASLYRATDYFEYVAIRNQVGDIVNSHAVSGNAPMNWAFGVLCPAIMALLPYCRQLSPRGRRAWFGAVWALMAVPAFLVGSRSMLVFLLGFPLFAFTRLHIHGRARRRRAYRRGMPWKTILLGTALGSLVFKSFSGDTFTEAVFGLLARALATPGAVTATYYVAFPSVFDFRGWPGVLMMPLAGESVDYTTISLTLLDLDSTANASFVAIAYSGAGFAGVFVASVLVVLLAFLVDLALLGVPGSLATALVVSNLFGIMALSSGPFLVAFTTFGFVLGPAVILAVLWACRGRSPAMEFTPVPPQQTNATG
jgi:hypothetical protein